MRAAGLLSRYGWLLIVLLFGCTAQGQNTASRTLAIKIIPQYVVVSGYWVEVEKTWNQHPRQSFTFTPQVYAGPTGQPDATISSLRSRQNETVRGGGGQVLHRLYLTTTKAAYPSGLYVSYGPHFQRFAVSYDGLGWQTVEGPNGLPLLEYRNYRHTETINRYGASAQLGYQVPLSPGSVFLDLYVGAGWRESRSRNKSGPVVSQYRSGSSDYGHKGFYFPAGFKLGVALR